jgi:hypothetical protein
MIEPVFYIVFIVSSIFLAWSSYRIGYTEGSRKGAEKCLEILHKQKVICYDNRGHIKPNPFFDHDPWVNVEEELS